MAKASSLVNGASSKYDPNHVYDLKIAEVFVDWKWNTRVDVASTNPETQTDEAGFSELVVSMAKDGQRTPCVVRPNPYKGKAGHPGARFEYMLVEGFGRTRARSDLAAGEHGVLLGKNGLTVDEANKLRTNEPTIRAYVIPMSEAEARKRNLGENMLRSQLTAPDIAYGVQKLAEAEPTASNVALGAMIGRSEPYVAKLRRIYSTFKDVTVPADALWKGSPAMPVTEAWRCAPKKALNEDMLAISDADKDGKLSAADKLNGYLMASGLKDNPNAKPTKTPGANAWVKNAPIDAKAFGVLLGSLERTGAISIEGIEADHWALVASKYAGKASKVTEDIKDAIAYACSQGIEEGRKAPKKPKAEAKAEEKAARTGKGAGKASAAEVKAARKGGKANGKAAHA